ncbi:MAG: AMP-binding protein [Clostridia bacterium]|nr:AMP-binding protein [Clostridia bacterium]
MNKRIRVVNKKKTDRIFLEANNVAELLAAYEVHGERIFYAWKENGEIKEISYGDFAALVKNIAKGICELYGEGGKKIAVIGETSPYWIASHLAIVSSGNVVVPMDKELDPVEISKFFEYADVSAIVHAKAFNTVFKDMVLDNKHPTVNCLIPINGEGLESTENANVITLNALSEMGKNSEAEFFADTDVERACELLFTSGTTGTSKCVMLCQKNIFANVMAACSTVDFEADDVLVSVLPLHHTYELMCTIAGSCYGMKFCASTSLRHVMKDFKEYRPTALTLVPLFVTTMYKRIMSEAKNSGKDKMLGIATKVAHTLKFAGIDLSEKVFKDVRAAFGGRLKKIICGGAALSPEMTSVFESFGISIYEGYGITECSPLVAVTPYFKRKPGSVGPAVPCNEVRIDGLETNELGYISGEIQVKGDNVMLGYMNNDEANAAVFTEDGWFRTGDVGYMDKDGYIFITGRAKSVIVLDNGKNVFPEEIEEYLEKIEEIAESVVVGRDEENGVKLVAVVVPAYEKFSDMEEVEVRTAIQKAITALNKRLPSFKQIHQIDFRKTEFEKTSSRKIKRHLVK